MPRAACCIRCAPRFARRAPLSGNGYSGLLYNALRARKLVDPFTSYPPVEALVPLRQLMGSVHPERELSGARAPDGALPSPAPSPAPSPLRFAYDAAPVPPRAHGRGWTEGRVLVGLRESARESIGAGYYVGPGYYGGEWERPTTTGGARAESGWLSCAGTAAVTADCTVAHTPSGGWGAAPFPPRAPPDSRTLGVHARAAHVDESLAPAERAAADVHAARSAGWSLRGLQPPTARPSATPQSAGAAVSAAFSRAHDAPPAGPPASRLSAHAQDGPAPATCGPFAGSYACSARAPPSPGHVGDARRGGVGGGALGDASVEELRALHGALGAVRAEVSELRAALARADDDRAAVRSLLARVESLEAERHAFAEPSRATPHLHHQQGLPPKVRCARTDTPDPLRGATDLRATSAASAAAAAAASCGGGGGARDGGVAGAGSGAGVAHVAGRADANGASCGADATPSWHEAAMRHFGCGIFAHGTGFAPAQGAQPQGVQAQGAQAQGAQLEAKHGEQRLWHAYMHPHAHAAADAHDDGDGRFSSGQLAARQLLASAATGMHADAAAGRIRRAMAAV